MQKADCCRKRGDRRSHGHRGGFPHALNPALPRATGGMDPHRRYPEVFPGPDTWRPISVGSCCGRRDAPSRSIPEWGVPSPIPVPSPCSRAGRIGICWRNCAPWGCVEDIDTVFLTHLHPDHVGWNLRPGGGPAQATFPRARYFTHRADWEAFKSPEVQGHFPFPYWQGDPWPLETLGILELLAGEQALTSEITAIPTPGHTPGSMGLAIVSGASEP